MSLLKLIDQVKAAADADNGKDQGKHAVLLEKIHQLQHAAETPDETVMRLRWQFLATFAIRFALGYGILQAICKSSNSVTAAELAKQTGADALLIVRIMRLVTHDGVCEEVDHGVYAPNDRTRFVTLPAIAGGYNHLHRFGFKTTQIIPDLIQEGKLVQFPQGPYERSPIQHAFGDTMFGMLSKDPRRKKIFDDYMEAWRYSKEPKYFEIFPAGENFAGELKAGKDEPLLIDVGGGKGHDFAAFGQRFPGLPGTLICQDLPQNFLGSRREAQGHGADGAQLLRTAADKSIVHDWQDDKCISILQNLVAAMDTERTRILIVDFVVPDKDVDWLKACLDLCMWLFCSGIERTMPQWQKLFDAVGLEVVQVHPTTLSRRKVIELRKRHRRSSDTTMRTPFVSLYVLKPYVVDRGGQYQT